MRILHTADIHLQAAGDERWKALETVLRTAECEEAGCVVISGDLFDKDAGVDALRPDLRRLFDSFPGRVLILPGNHDSRRMSSGLHFGSRVEVLGRSGSTAEVEGVRFFAFPFERIGRGEVVSRLLSLSPGDDPDVVDVLLFHGELLDAAYTGDEYEADAAEYMPVSLVAFEGLGFRYVLAGHFHTRFDVYDYGDGWFVYPGSPVSITEKETGRRKVALVDPGEKPRELEIDTFHYDRKEIALDALSGADPLELVKEEASRRHELCRLHLVVSGFVDLSGLGKDEKDFDEALKAIGNEHGVEIESRWINIERVSESDLYRRFARRIAGVTDPSLKRAMDRMAIRALAEVLDET